MEKEMINQLIDTAIHQLKYSYTPYSNFKVGAALLAKNGQVYTGCNIENAVYPVGTCAERTAMSKAVSEGHTDFVRIVIAGRSRVLDRASVREALGQGRVGHHAASGLLVLQDAVDSIENGRLWFGNQIIVGHISSVLCSEGFGDGVLQPFPA